MCAFLKNEVLVLCVKIPLRCICQLCAMDMDMDKCGFL